MASTWDLLQDNPLGPPQPWQGRSPRIKPPLSDDEAWGQAVDQALNQPDFRQRVYNAVTGAGNWIAEKATPFIPPELRPKIGALGQIADIANPATEGGMTWMDAWNQIKTEAQAMGKKTASLGHHIVWNFTPEEAVKDWQQYNKLKPTLGSMKK